MSRPNSTPSDDQKQGEPRARAGIAPPQEHEQADPTALALWYRQALYWNVTAAEVPMRYIGGEMGCSCRETTRCQKPGKHPEGTWKHIRAPLEPLRLYRKFTDGLPRNISVLLGDKCGGLSVGDVDVRHGGRLETLWEMGWPQETPIARSGSGGHHVYVQGPAEGLPTNHSYAEGIELLSNGAQVIAPPSLHICGNHYSWVPGHEPWAVPVAALPEAVLATLPAASSTATHRLRVGEPQPDRENPDTLAYSLEETERIAAGLFRWALRKVAEGEGRNTMTYRLSRQLDSLGLMRSEVAALAAVFSVAVDHV
jgi:hypothetical protein